MTSFYGGGGVGKGIPKALLEKIKEIVAFFNGESDDKVIFSGGDAQDETSIIPKENN